MSGLCYDTLADVPQIRTVFDVWELLGTLQDLYVGFVVHGNATPMFDREPWGRAIHLPGGETFSLRAHPRGILEHMRTHKDEYRPEHVIVATRHCTPSGDNRVAVAVFWAGVDVRNETRDVDIELTAERAKCSLGARNLHVLLPSLFEHHDPTDSKYIQTNARHYHCLRSTSFSVHVAMSESRRFLTSNARSGNVHGTSVWLLAARLCGVELEDDLETRACEKKTFSEWKRIAHSHCKKLLQLCGKEKAAPAVLNAYGLTDLLTIEGLVFLFSQPFLAGALPDALHVPGGLSFAMAMALRVASRPEWFGLSHGTELDAACAREVAQLFEGNWAPVHSRGQTEVTRNVTALDICIRRAIRDARAEGAQRNFLEDACTDNLNFWQRAGQRAITAVFRPLYDDHCLFKPRFGNAEQMVDPIMEAKKRHFADLKTDTRADMELYSLDEMPMPMPERRAKLITLLNSVENWLRTGTYCGQQLAPSNERLEAARRAMREQRDLTDEEKRAHTAYSAQEKEWSEQIKELVDENELGGFEDDREMFEAFDFKYESLCIAAVKQGLTVAIAALCNGAAISAQMGAECYVSHRGATNVCPQTGDEVHVLSATLFENKFSWLEDGAPRSFHRAQEMAANEGAETA